MIVVQSPLHWRVRGNVLDLLVAMYIIVEGRESTLGRNKEERGIRERRHLIHPMMLDFLRRQRDLPLVFVLDTASA